METTSGGLTMHMPIPLWTYHVPGRGRLHVRIIPVVHSQCLLVDNSHFGGGAHSICIW